MKSPLTEKIFKAKLDIIGINPFVFVPEKILQHIFKLAGKDKGHIPIIGTVNGKAYKQNLVKYSGAWRLYINTSMLKNSPKKIGEVLEITISYDAASREIAPPEKFVTSLKKNPAAKKLFDNLTPSRRKEIIRYLANLKTEKSLEKNIQRAIDFLIGKEKFVGRKKANNRE